jgi:hypothetical protein
MIISRDSVFFESFQIFSLCLVWYGKSHTFFLKSILIFYLKGVSAAGNVIVKELLNDFPFPLTVTLVQLFSVWILSIPLLRYAHQFDLFDYIYNSL